MRNSTDVGHRILLNDILTSKSRWRDWVVREVLNMELRTSNMSQDKGISLTRSRHFWFRAKERNKSLSKDISALIHDHFHLGSYREKLGLISEY